MWGGRFEKEPDTGFMEFSSSVGFDVRLYPYDLACTKAWSAALMEAGIMSPEETAAISDALDSIGRELDAGLFDFVPADEDIHAAIERRLSELVGASGGKVRTGRSRNDQVATDMRMFVKDACRELSGRVRKLQVALLAQAEGTTDVTVPGHTHLQQAQPVLLAHALLAFVHMLERDVALLSEAYALADVMPLGSGALAGTGFPVDRYRLSESLGFSEVSRNSMDAVSDRDFVCAALFSMTMIMTHLSRLSEQMILWCSQEFGLARLDDAWSTGSSIMPQKKNPDGLELIRAKTGRVEGGLVAMLTVLKGLPLTYNRDLQEDKEGLFDALDTVMGCLTVMEGIVSTVEFDRERAGRLADGGFLTATDLADYMAFKGVKFPEAHKVVGQVVSYCIREGKALAELEPDELAGFSDVLGEETLEWLSLEASLSRRSSVGGTAPEEVARQLAAAKEMVSGTQQGL